MGITHVVVSGMIASPLAILFLLPIVASSFLQQKMVAAHDKPED